MRRVNYLSLWTKLFLITVLVGFSCSAFAGSVVINSPAAKARFTGHVSIAASASENVDFHLELWDNGNKLGDVFSNVVNASYPMSTGAHTLTVLAVSPNGVVLDKSSVAYTISTGSDSEVSISSPAADETVSNAVQITASANVNGISHLEIWDNGYKLGNVFSSSVSGVYVMPVGSHTLTVQAISGSGAVLSKSSVNYTVAEQCTNSGSSQCDLDQLSVDNAQRDCDPPEESRWVANPCGAGVQGDGGADPVNTWMGHGSTPSQIPDQGNLTLNGSSVHLLETQDSAPSNVLFRAQSPVLASTSSIDSHWTLGAYVYLPDPTAHQAFEIDAQYSVAGIWTKFYTECAFNINNGTGYWAVFDSATGGWIFLNGKEQNGQTPPVVPCNRSQFAQPWSGSSNPSFTGWHHIAWNFLRNSDGTVTFQSLTFDGTTTQINFHPNSLTGGDVNDNGHFSALVQLDGVDNRDRHHDIVDAYISELSLTHTP